MPILSTIKTFLLRNQKTLSLMLLFTVLPLLSSAFIFSQALTLEAEFQDNFSAGAVITIMVILCFTMAFALTPTTFIALLGGYFVGWYSAVPIVVCYTIASIFGYQLGKIVDAGRLLRSIGVTQSMMNFIQRLHDNEVWLIFFSRISPILPFAVMNIVLSGLRVNFQRFLWAGLVGMLPRTLFFIWVGIKAESIADAWNSGKSLPISQMLTLGLIVLSIGGISFVIKRSLRQAKTQKSL